MKLDIPYYIRQVLREKRMVNIPGIGTLKLEHFSARFNDDRTIISPPSLNIAFDDAESDDQSLLRYIMDTGLMSEEKASKKIYQFTQTVFNRLLNVNSFLIDGIGLITKNEGEVKVNFEPHLQNLTREFGDLKPVSLSPITRISEKSAMASRISKESSEKDSGSFLPRIILLSLLLICLYFLGRYLYDNYFNDPETQEIGVIDDNSEDGALTYNDSSEKALEQKYEEIDELIDPIKGKEKVDNTDNSKLGEELDVLTNQTEEKGDASIKEGMGGSNDLKNSESVIENSKDTSIKADVKEKPLNKYSNIIPETGECIIIVGSFIKSLNTIKMVSLLERKGFKVHQSEYKGYTRVGIKYECIDEDLASYLQNIRKKISSKAWYLDPELEVPYLK